MEKIENLTTVVLTYNEEEHIKGCLDSVKERCQKVLVVDCFSKDATCKIAEKVADAIYKVEFKGFGHLRSFALKRVDTEWVLFVDADERVEEGLWERIKEAMKRGEDAFYIPRKSHFLGRWIRRCGWYPDYVLRLLKKEKVYYDEKVLVHERPFVKGKVGYIKGAHLLHYPYTSWQECLQKVQSYSALFAKQRGSAPSIFSAFFKAIASFINVYIVKGGFLEKEEGLALSVLQSFYTFLKYAR